MAHRSTNSDVPEFPEFAPLEAGHRDAVRRAAQAAQPRSGEMTFSYLFAWREYLSPRLSAYGDALLVLVRSGKDEMSYLMPPLGPGDRAETLRDVLPRAAEENITDSASRLPDDVGRTFDEDDAFEAVSERGRWDYVYRREDLASLDGPELRDKRNRANRFRKTYSGVAYRAIDPEAAERCIEFARQWRRNHPKGDEPGLVREVEAVTVMLENLDWLSLVGGMMECDGEVVAFSLGEKLNDETFAVRAEKADTSYHGSYQVINQEFVRDAAEDYRLVNRESDMGVPGIRRAKQSYNPCHMVEKWRVTLK